MVKMIGKTPFERLTPSTTSTLCPPINAREADDAYIFLSIAAKARIAQIVDPLYTVVAKLSKRYLKE